ncbi:hypothetical protein ACLK19_17315 [Escherichia coli]
MKRLYKSLEERGYEIHISDEALKPLSQNGYDPAYGARPLNVLSSSRLKTRWHSKYCLVNWFRQVIRLEVNEDRIVASSK